MKLKNLRKKIRRLEKRLQEGPQKLAKLRRKLEAMEAVKATAPRRESSVRARPPDKPLTPIQRKLPAQRIDAQKPDAVKKAKRRFNLSPKRWAQFAAAMKVRWAARRAGTEANSKTASTVSTS